MARDLLGKVLRHETRQGVSSGRIVEVEAYLGEDDPASHAHRGPTPRARVMFGDGGRAYVYLSYGNHHCMNVVTDRKGVAGAVLIRALEPLEGIPLMRQRRGREEAEDLCSGPGKLAQALGITLAQNELDLGDSPLTLLEGAPPERILTSSRIGISRAKERPFRFFEPGNPHVSHVRQIRADALAP